MDNLEEWAKPTGDERMVYIVSDNDYEPSVVGVFTTAELAEGYGDEVLPIRLLDHAPRVATCYYRRANLHYDGRVKDETEWSDEQDEYQHGWGRKVREIITNKGQMPFLVVSGYNRERVEEVYRERLPLLQAELPDIAAFPLGLPVVKGMGG